MNLKYSRTRKGVATRIYGSQTHNSKVRRMNPPSYSKMEFAHWLFSNKLFDTLYKNWVDSGFNKKK